MITQITQQKQPPRDANVSCLAQAALDTALAHRAALKTLCLLLIFKEMSACSDVKVNTSSWLFTELLL